MQMANEKKIPKKLPLEEALFKDLMSAMQKSVEGLSKNRSRRLRLTRLLEQIQEGIDAARTEPLTGSAVSALNRVSLLVDDCLELVTNTDAVPPPVTPASTPRSPTFTSIAVHDPPPPFPVSPSEF